MPINREEAHNLVDALFDLENTTTDAPYDGVGTDGSEHTDEGEPERHLPEGKRVVRTKSSGDRVYLIDEVANTRQWLTNPEVLADQGFEASDVVEIEDPELVKYKMESAIYRLKDADA